jgi:predicted RNA-binding protein with PUA-like domain
MATRNYWLFKSEPETYSFDQLTRDKKTNWDHVRNFQARNFLREVRPGDLALIYHSGDEKQVVGIAEVTREAYPDPDPEQKGDWVQIDLKPVRSLPAPVTLKTIKATASLAIASPVCRNGTCNPYTTMPCPSSWYSGLCSASQPYFGVAFYDPDTVIQSYGTSSNYGIFYGAGETPGFVVPGRITVTHSG